ncbi:unnamed protein product, partial [Rotaria magnacalcarata]
MRTSKTSILKPRLSVHERQKQRLATSATIPVSLMNSNEIQSNEINSTISSMNTTTPTSI